MGCTLNRELGGVLLYLIQMLKREILPTLKPVLPTPSQGEESQSHCCGEYLLDPYEQKGWPQLLEAVWLWGTQTKLVTPRAKSVLGMETRHAITSSRFNS